MNNERVAGSFRDPCGFVFKHKGQIYRQINPVASEAFDLLLDSGLYRKLTEAGFLIKHEDVETSDFSSSTSSAATPDILPGRIIRPQQLEFISYPWEWSFSQLKDAALLTLQIQKTALDHGMSLKDCSAFNIQFKNGRPLLIDTLSFEIHPEGSPWVAYRQFCQHFLAPLALMSRRDIRLQQLFRVYIDGLPLDLTSRLLPWSSCFSFSLLTHVHLHARSQLYYAGKSVQKAEHQKMSRLALLGIIDSLESGVRALNFSSQETEWGDYYSDTNYSQTAAEQKKLIISGFFDRIDSRGTVWDLGANTGVFSRIASSRGLNTISFDIDPVAVEKNYRQCRSDNETCLLPLLLDLTNPSPALGWENSERLSLLERGPADTVMALALLHHLAISNNLPLAKIAEFFARICSNLIIEFVPKTDSQVQRLLVTREDIFSTYTQTDFENEFGRFFKISASEQIRESSRILYLMQKR